MRLFSARVRRSVALLLALFFLAASSAYAAHLHLKAGAPVSQTPCDLCLHFGATADAPPPPAVASPVEFIVQVSVLSLEKTALPERRVRAHGSRAPPVLSV